MRFPSILVFAAATSFSAAIGSAATLTWPGPAPCGTGLQACINAAAAGDIILVQTNNPINEDLTIDKSLTLKAQVGFTPRLGALHYIFLSNPSPRNNVIVLEDFRCDRARIFAVQSSTGSFNVSMRRLNIENTYNDGPAIQIRTGQTPPYGPVVFDLSNNRVTIPAGSQFNGAQAVSIEGGDAASMTGVVRGNVIDHRHGGQSGAIGLYNLHANPFHVDVIANTITGSNYNDGILLFQFGNGTSQVRYLDNLVVGQVNVAGAPGAYVVNISEGAATFEIVNNTTTAGGIGILVGGRDDLGASWSGTVANNIVSDMTGGGIQIDQPTQTSGTVDNDHNLVYDVAFNNFTPGPGTLFVDPLFLGGGDYHLSITSSAVNSGNSARVPLDLTTDLDGLARQVGTVDMGAYETGCLAAGATWPVCGVPMATKPGPQLNSCLVADGAGGAFLSYTHLDSISSPNPNIWLNHVDANGDPAPGWPIDGFPITALPGSRSTSRAVPDGSGGAFVAWDDSRNDPGNLFYDVYLQHITSSGSPAPGWPVNGLAVHPITPSADEFLASLVSDGAGGAFLLWSGSGGMVLNRITGSGTVHPNWPPSGTVVTTAAAQLIADGAGGVYVCWSISTPTSSLRLTRLTGLGAYASGWPSAGVVVTTLSSTSFALDLGRDGSHVNLAWTMSTGEVRASRLLSSGSIAPGWSAFGVGLSATPDPKSFLMVTHGGTSGEVVAVWREDLPAPDGFQVVAQRLTPTGAVAAGWPATGWVVLPNFAQSGNGQVRAFPDCNNGTTLAWTSSGLRALRFTPSATVAPGWPATGVLLCGGAFSFVTPNVAWACPDGTGGVMTGFPRALPGSGNAFNRVDIYAQCVRGDGTVNEGFGGATPVGSNVVVPLGPATVTFPTVTTAGQTFLELADSGPPPPFGLQIVPTSAPVYYDVTTTAQYQSPVQVCIAYDPAALQGPENALQLLHFDATLQPPDWVNVTTTIDVNANVICGSTPTLSPFVIAEADPTDVAEGLPRAYRLFANIPNPFNPTTTIHYELPAAGHVKLDVLDVGGRLVRTLVNGHVEAGRRFAVWEGRDDKDLRVASGVYFYRLRAGAFVETRRMVLLK